MNLDGDSVVGGVEYIPSLKVPYQIPKGDKIAFLSCVYHSSSEYDYKTYALWALEKRLSEKYDTLVAITDELGTFPNGNLNWFIKNGFKDLGLIHSEANYCNLHLVMKDI